MDDPAERTRWDPDWPAPVDEPDEEPSHPWASVRERNSPDEEHRWRLWWWLRWR